MLLAAPTPCSRTGFHMIKISLWLAAPVVAHGPAVVAMQVGSTMIKSPGNAASIALWMLPEARTCFGVLPPIVTVTVSIDCLPLAAVMTSCPHCVDVAPGAY